MQKVFIFLYLVYLLKSVRRCKFRKCNEKTFKDLTSHVFNKFCFSERVL